MLIMLLIQKHKWFSGFDWQLLQKRGLTPPIIPDLTNKWDHKYFEAPSVRIMIFT